MLRVQVLAQFNCSTDLFYREKVDREADAIRTTTRIKLDESDLSTITVYRSDDTGEVPGNVDAESVICYMSRFC